MIGRKIVLHVGFGLVKFKDKNFLSRKGEVILLRGTFKYVYRENQNCYKMKRILILKIKGRISQKVGIGAIVFNYLKMNRERDIIFDFDEVLSFEGETGPYVQYTLLERNIYFKKKRYRYRKFRIFKILRIISSYE